MRRSSERGTGELRCRRLRAIQERSHVRDVQLSSLYNARTDLQLDGINDRLLKLCFQKKTYPQRRSPARATLRTALKYRAKGKRHFLLCGAKLPSLVGS